MRKSVKRNTTQSPRSACRFEYRCYLRPLNRRSPRAGACRFGYRCYLRPLNHGILLVHCSRGRYHGAAERCIPGGGRAAPPNALRAPILLSGAAGTPGTASSHIHLEVLSARCRCAAAASSIGSCCICIGISRDPQHADLPESAQNRFADRFMSCWSVLGMQPDDTRRPQSDQQKDSWRTVAASQSPTCRSCCESR